MYSGGTGHYKPRAVASETGYKGGIGLPPSAALESGLDSQELEALQLINHL